MHRPTLLRSLAAVALAVVSLSAFAQDLPKVTFSQPVMKASAVLAEISKQTGVHLASDPIVGNIPILVSVTDAPLDQLLARIALATGGELKAEGEGFRLVNNDGLRREQAAKETGWVIEAFDRAKKRLAGQNTTPGRWDEKTVNDLVAKAEERRRATEERMRQIEMQQGARISMFDSSAVSATPASSSARRILDLLPSSVLASVGPGDRIVYALTPTRMQRRMPINVQPIVNDFVYNHNLIAQRAPQLRPDPRVTMVGALTSGEPIQSIAETHVVLSRGYRSTTVQVEVKFVDRNGIIVGQGSTSIAPEYQNAAAQANQEGKAIELSELSRQMAVLMAQETASPSSDRNVYRVATAGNAGGAFVTLAGGDGTLPKQVPEDLLNVLVNPDKYDPASLYVSEAYIQTAKAGGKDLVATFPDRIVRDMARALVAGNVTTKGVLASSASYGMTLQSEGEWLVATPTWADNTRKTNFNREKAGALFRSVNTRGFATLDELGDYSFWLTLGLPDRPLDMAYLSLINKDTADTLNEYVSLSLDLLRVYASIPDNVKRTNGEAMNIPFRSLVGNAKTSAEHSYYAGNVGAGMFPGAGQFSAMIMTMEISEGEGRPSGPPPNSILTEPTEALPNGIPGEAVLTVMRQLQEGVYASIKGLRGGQLLSAQELGMRQGMLQANFGGGAPPPDFDTFVPAQIVNVQIALELQQYGRPSAMFKDGWLVSGARAVSYNGLPEGFRAQVDRAKQNMMAPPPIPATGTVRRGGGG